MSEEQLYQLARQRIDRKNRRWLLWSVNFFAFLLYVGAFTAFSGIPHNVGEFMEHAWFAGLVLHTVLIVLTQDQEDNVGSEVAKLRKATGEKPKRREFSDYGDLSAPIEPAHQRISRS